jgi:hypothetical protein
MTVLRLPTRYHDFTSAPSFESVTISLDACSEDCMYHPFMGDVSPAAATMGASLCSTVESATHKGARTATAAKEKENPCMIISETRRLEKLKSLTDYDGHRGWILYQTYSKHSS